MELWVVLEEDRGCGVFVCGIYNSRELAEEACETGNCYVEGPFEINSSLVFSGL